MSSADRDVRLVEIETTSPVWDRFFTVAPLVLVGTTGPDGSPDFAPKHMVTPMGWDNYFGFVCTPGHATCRNARRTGEFTVSFPKPAQVLTSSLAASPRDARGGKSVLGLFRTIPTIVVDGACIEGAYLYFECRLFKTVDGFGENCLVTGEIVAARAEPSFLRSSDVDDQERLRQSPLFAYLPPGRFAAVARSNAFPFPADMRR